MKFLGNIVCTFAIIAQVLLGAGLLTHAPDCGATQPINASHPALTSDTHSHHCHCEQDEPHHHIASPDPVHSDSCFFFASNHEHDCKCTPQKTYPYVLSEYSALQKPKDSLSADIALTSNHLIPSFFSSLLREANQSNAPPPRIRELPQHHTRYASIYLGVYLI